MRSRSLHGAASRPKSSNPSPRPLERGGLTLLAIGVTALCLSGIAVAEPGESTNRTSKTSTSVKMSTLAQSRESGVWTSLPPANPHPKERIREVLSDPFAIDRIFKSMLGPVTTRPVGLLKTKKPELLWVTGYQMDVVAEDGETSESMEFTCHTNLAWPRKQPPLGLNRPVARAFTLTQGQTDLRLPPGFGMPLLSDEKLTFNSQALNLNRPNADRVVRHRTQIRFVRDADLSQPMKPLVSVAAQGLVTLEDEPQIFDVENAHSDEGLEGASCHVGDYAGQWEGGIFTDKHNRRFAPHWVVPPGRHEYRTLVTDNIRIPYDTTIHFIGVHVHPHSESLELRDLTTGKSLFKSYQTDGDGVDLTSKWADYYSSEEGMPVYKDHEYELISVYNNQSGQDADAMAGMFIYYLNRAYHHPLQNPPGPPAS